MKAFLLKVDSALYIQWTRAAKGSGLNVSEWIRAQCNKRLEINEVCADGERRVKEAREKSDAKGLSQAGVLRDEVTHIAGSLGESRESHTNSPNKDYAEGHPAQDLPRVGNVPAPERRAGVARNVSASSGK